MSAGVLGIAPEMYLSITALVQQFREWEGPITAVAACLSFASFSIHGSTVYIFNISVQVCEFLMMYMYIGYARAMT